MEFETSFATALKAIAPQLQRLLEDFGRSRVMLIGDLMVDEFVTGQVERFSREAPVLILRHESTRQVPGGAANAAYNLAKLGATVHVVGVVGDDAPGRVLLESFARAGIKTHGVVVDPTRPTVTKTRIAGHARQSVTQQIVRVDRKSDEPLDAAVRQSLVAAIQAQIATVDAVVCSDYGDGVFTESVIAAALRHSCTVVDAQSNLERYWGAAWFTPNLPEAEQAVGYAIATPEGLLQAGHDLLSLTHAHHILITRGDEGMSLFSRDHPPQHIPAFNRTDVFDVTGAGDTVVAALTLGLIAGASPWEAALLGNLAASIVVRKFGTATTTPDEMETALQMMLEKLLQSS